MCTVYIYGLQTRSTDWAIGTFALLYCLWYCSWYCLWYCAWYCLWHCLFSCRYFCHIEAFDIKNGLKILYCVEWFTIMTCIDLINCGKEVLISIFFFLRLQLTAKILNTIHDTTQDCTYHFSINLEPNTILFSTKSIGKWWIQSDTIWGRGMN